MPLPIRNSGKVILTCIIVWLFIFLVIKISGAPPLAVFFHIFKGALGSWNSFSYVLKVWVPLVLCAYGLIFTFRTGLWNIGVEGQVIMGAVFATMVLRCGIESTTPGFYLSLSFFAGLAGGAIWSLAAGVLKTKGGIHEIFSGLGLNFVAQGIGLWLIFGPWKRSGIASMSGTEIFPTELWLTDHPWLQISLVGLLLAISVMIFTGFLLERTNMGLGLKAIGINNRSAFLFGLKPDRYLLAAMLFSGGFAGLAGTIQVTGVYHRLIPSISCNYGYLALLVVMLANYNVWAVPMIALFFACLNVGSIQLPIVLQVDSSLSGVIQGVLVMAALAVYGWRIKTKREKRQIDREL